MITVRFPSGFSVQYNDATDVTYLGSPNFIARLTRPNTKNPGSGAIWIADVSVHGGGIVENQIPCKTYDANEVKDGTIARLFLDRIRHVSRQSLVEVKNELRKFNAKTRQWGYE